MFIREALRLIVILPFIATLAACDPSYLIEPHRTLRTDCGDVVVSDKPTEGRMMLMWYISNVASYGFCDKGVSPTGSADTKLPFQHAAERHLAGTSRSHCQITGGTIAGLQSAEFTYVCPAKSADSKQR